jgi:hypothetical protein
LIRIQRNVKVGAARDFLEKSIANFDATSKEQLIILVWQKKLLREKQQLNYSSYMARQLKNKL